MDGSRPWECDGIAGSHGLASIWCAAVAGRLGGRGATGQKTTSRTRPDTAFSVDLENTWSLDGAGACGHGHLDFCRGGPRVERHRGLMLAMILISPPQQGQMLTGAARGAGAGSAPMSNGRPVWKAMRSRLALAAG